jgi:nicotinamide riboside kinase
MKVGLLGPQGSGKTTLAYEVATKLKKDKHDVYVLSEVARSCPLPINQNTTRETQLWIIGKQITREQSAKGKTFISDRTVLDPYCYGLRIDYDFFSKLRSFVEEYMKTYDLIFYVEPNDEYLIDDGTRSTNKDFRNEFNKIIKTELSIMDINYQIIKSTDVDDVLMYFNGCD